MAARYRYQTGVASSPTDLLDQFVAFLVAQGWTTLAHAADGAGKRAHLSKAGLFVNLRSALNETSPAFSHYNTGGYSPVARTGLGVNVGSGYDAGKNWRAQPGVPSTLYASYITGQDAALAHTAAGTISYHAFDDGADNIVLVASNAAGGFTHLAFGPSVHKLGAGAGGAYFFAESLATTYSGYSSAIPLAGIGFVQAAVDSTPAGAWLGVNASLGRACASESSYLPVQFPTHAQLGPVGVSAMSNQANLLPINVLAARDGGGWSYLGMVPNVYRCDAVGAGFAAGQVYTVGNESYMLFPNFAVRKYA